MTLLFLLVALCPLLALGEVYIVDSIDLNGEVLVLPDVAATFGKSIPEAGLKGRLETAKPLNACLPLLNPTPTNATIVLIARYGGCNFADKVRAATAAGFHAAIIFNINSNKLVPMGGDGHTDGLIPSVFIGYGDAELVMRRYADKDRYGAIITAESPFDINAYLLPFAVVVVICFLVMLCVVLYKCFQDYRRSRRHRLPKAALKKIPIIKFKTGDPYETCVICLDDFVEGDRVRVLPCDHGYHQKCIDPWLLKTKRICPQCRKRVFSRRNTEELATSGEAGESSDTETDERAPLIRPRDGNRGGGTFAPAPSNQELLQRADQQRRLHEQQFLQQQQDMRRQHLDEQNERRQRRRQARGSRPRPGHADVEQLIDPSGAQEPTRQQGGSLPPTFLATVETHGMPQAVEENVDTVPVLEFRPEASEEQVAGAGAVVAEPMVEGDTEDADVPEVEISSGNRPVKEESQSEEAEQHQEGGSNLEA